ncbi:MAG: STAS domain-containing protein [Candidatus Riflebacteria bacterium]|nr:STAS domain-containing protein [Candidatus Riflebacteria bacterium]
MEIEKKKERGFLILTLFVDINVENSILLDTYFQQAIDDNEMNIIVNFSNISYVGSSGIGVLARRFRQLREKNGTVILAGCNDSIRRIFELINFQSFFKIFSKLEDAF